MDDTAKYLIHADITADGVVERSDVVGAVFGQTEGLLGDDLDLRDLQQTSKVGRIDVSIQSRNGTSYGTITIASSLDKVETAILAAALETIGRVGPCHSTVSIDRIEDVRAAKRREVVERAKELLSMAFDDDVMSSEKLLEEVRQSVRVERITEYEGLPAGPRVGDSDAIIVVEGRSDVLALLQYGVKNAIAVEGTNIPDAVAELTGRRNVTAFLDGDRGGDLILKELAQVGDVDYVAFAPAGRSVEDLERHELMTALREKVPFDALDTESPEADHAEIAAGDVAATDGSIRPAPDSANDGTDGPAAASAEAVEPAVDEPGDTDEESDDTVEEPGDTGEGVTESVEEATEDDATEDDEEAPDLIERPPTLREHVATVVGEETGQARLLDADARLLSEVPVDETFAAIEDADAVPSIVVLDGALEQPVLDVASQRGVERVIAREQGQFAKKPVGVRVTLAADVAA
jgi:DNA primase